MATLDVRTNLPRESENRKKKTAVHRCKSKFNALELDGRRIIAFKLIDKMSFVDKVQVDHQRETPQPLADPVRQHMVSMPNVGLRLNDSRWVIHNR